MAVFIGLFVITILAASAWYLWPQMKVKSLDIHDKDLSLRLELLRIETEIRKASAPMLGGAALIFTAAFGFYEISSAVRDADFDNDANLFTLGTEMLADKSALKQVAGIQTLEYWATRPAGPGQFNSEERRDFVAASMVTYVQAKTIFPINSESCTEFARPHSIQVSSEVQKAIDTLAKLSEHEGIRGNFRGLNLSRGDFHGGNFSGASFAFSDLSEADLSGSDLRGADLYCANLYRTNLAGANLSSLGERRTNLISASLIESEMGVAGSNVTDLSGANLIAAKLQDVDVKDVIFSDTLISEAKLIRVETADDEAITAECERSPGASPIGSASELRRRCSRPGAATPPSGGGR